MTRRWWVGAVLSLAIAVAAWGGVAEYRYRSDLDRAIALLRAGKVDEAAGRLQALARSCPGRTDWAAPLAEAEAKSGHIDAALAAWARVPQADKARPSAALLRGRYALEHHRFGIAEEAFTQVLGRAGGAATEKNEAAQALARLYRY